MPYNLIDSVKDFITPDLINKASAYLGENPQNILKAVEGAIPLALAGLLKRAESGGTSDILNKAKEAAGTVLSNPGSIFSGGSLPSGSNLVNNVLGSQESTLTNALAAYSGIKTSSASSLLNMIVPIILGLIGKHAADNNLTTGGLSSLLSEHKTSLLSALPSGLNIADWFSAAKNSIHAATGELHSITATEKRNWLWPAILGLLVLILIIYFWRSCNKAPEATPQTDTTAAAPAMADTGMMSTPERESLKVKLADGTEIDAYKGGIEDELVACLNDAGCTAGKDKWFDFDNLNFETGSAVITTASQPQVNNIAAILKAYPKAKIKIGGYTDKTGDEAVNKKLSQDRADAVVNAIKTAGANTSQLAGAEGYGSQLATVAATASDEDRRKDRRISVQLREK